MNRFHLLALPVLLVLGLGLPVAAEETASAGDVAGEWAGTLQVGVPLRLALHVSRADDGALSSTLDSFDQNATLDVSATTFEEGVLRLSLPRIGASFEGTMTDDGAAIEGSWTQGPQTLPLTLERRQEALTLVRPQEPQPPFPYASTDITFRNEGAGIDLAGTLLVPEGEGPFPAVLFVTGSGPQDRDESLMGHKPFLVIADHLARHGIASLRFDDRGFGASGGDHMGSTVEDFASDAAAGLDFLAARPEVDTDRLGIVGHSEGGMSGPLAALERPEVDFLVLLAAPAVPLTDLLQRQAADLLRASGTDDDLIERAISAQGADLDLLTTGDLSDADIAAELRRRSAERRTELSAEQIAALELDEASVERSIRVALTPWFRSLLRIDPTTYLGKLRVPVLALYGGHDLQVAPEENAEAMRAALAENPGADVRVLPGLNHLFQHAETGVVSEYGAIEETFAPQALTLIADWIRDRMPPVSP